MNNHISYQLVGKRRGSLSAPKSYKTSIKPKHTIDHGAIRLEPTGLLTLRTGFVWDFATGAIDTPDMVVASAAHDALCVLVDEGYLPTQSQKDIDIYFRELLKELGTGFVRRWYLYLAVRVFQTFTN